MIALLTTTWFGPDGVQTPQPADTPLPADHWAAIARSRHGRVQLIVRDRDASLNYDPDSVLPEVLQAAERAIGRLTPRPTSVTRVEWHHEQITRRVLSRLDPDESDLFAGLASF